MKYQLTLYQDYPNYYKTFAFNTIEPLIDRINNMKPFETITELIEYHLVYKHSIFLPACDYVHEYTHKDIYKEKIKIPKENIITAKKKDYKNNLLNEDCFSNYCLKYSFLELDTEEGYFIRNSATFDLKRNDLIATTKQLYELSKSNQIFNLEFYQYKAIDPKCLNLLS